MHIKFTEFQKEHKYTVKYEGESGYQIMPSMYTDPETGEEATFAWDTYIMIAEK